LGLTVTERRDVLGEACIFLRAGNEHHSLALMPARLKDKLGFGAACSFAVASYQQLLDARAHLTARGVRTLDLPAELSPGVSYGFWVQGPDAVAVQIVYGTERHGVGARLPASHWPETIDHGGDSWHEPVFMGPLA
ncbi:MAG TPA: hypothetical protein VNT42_00730, partial [Sphingomonas sp.]|nr:hypothetical protein [Sphingomonas sp.]